MPRARRRPDLPQTLIGLPRTTRELHAAGVTAHELAGPLWTPLRRGLHLWSPPGRLEPETRISAALADAPPGATLGGWAALRRHGVTVLDGRTGPGAARDLPVQLCIGPTARVRPRDGVDLDRSTIVDVDLTLHADVPVTTPARSCLDVARRLGAEEGLVATDAALRAGVVTHEELQSCVARMIGLKAVPIARCVVSLADGRAESAPESRLRYVWVIEAGLPKPHVNPVVRDARGDFRGRADLLDLESGMVGEYDGANHRELGRHTADNVREEGLESLNLVVARATALDLWPHRRRLVRRLLDTRARGLSRDRSRDAWTLDAA